MSHEQSSRSSVVQVYISWYKGFGALNGATLCATRATITAATAWRTRLGATCRSFTPQWLDAQAVHEVRWNWVEEGAGTLKSSARICQYTTSEVMRCNQNPIIKVMLNEWMLDVFVWDSKCRF